MSKKSICSESSLRRYIKKCETCITSEIIDRAIASWILYILNSNLLQLGSNSLSSYRTIEIIRENAKNYPTFRSSQWAKKSPTPHCK